jgi:GTP cyclohydrolase I
MDMEGTERTEKASDWRAAGANGADGERGQGTAKIGRVVTPLPQPCCHERLPTPIEGSDRGVDLVRATRAVAELLDALGVDRKNEGVVGTPARVAQAYAEMLTPEPFEATTFPNEEGYDELVVVRDIAFSSLCEHHLLPFVGVAHVAYLPGRRLLGLSKLARVVTHYSRRLQVQERLTTQVADWLVAALQPKGAGVVIEADHMCMSLRGVKATGARTLTSALHGVLRDDPRSRQEFFVLTTTAP